MTIKILNNLGGGAKGPVKVDFVGPVLARVDINGNIIAGPQLTVSTQNPSGGSNGDIWIKYNP